MVTGELTLYAQWIELFTVTFNSNGGDSVTAQIIEDGSVAIKPIPTRTGYGFKHWYLNNEDTAFDFNTPIRANITLTAKWDADKYSIVFDTQDGRSPVNTLATHDDHITRPANPERTGYTFDYWSTDLAGNHEYDFENTVVTGELTLYAQWTINSYTVTFKKNDGTDDTYTTDDADFGTTIDEPAEPSRTGYNFIGWYKDVDGVTAWNFDLETMPVDGVTLYAKWEIKRFEVTFNVNGGNPAPENQIINHGSTVVQPSVTREHYHLLAWCTDEECTEEFDFATPVTGAMTLYAKWEINSYQVSFNTQGGTPISAVTVEYNSTFTAPTNPVKDGCTFAGWYKEAACNNEWIFDTDRMGAANMTLYAKWNVTVTFNSNGGSPVQTVTMREGSTVVEPTAPSKAGCRFLGWYYLSYEYCYDENLDSWDWAYVEREFNFNTPITKDTVLMAEWQEVCQITFDTNCDISIRDRIVDLGSVTAEPVILREGYVFQGWFLDNTLFDFNTPITENIVLVAIWQAIPYTITFESNCDIRMGTRTVPYGNKIIEPKIIRVGYNFKGWYVNEILTSAYDFDTPVTGPLILYAKWEKIVVEPEPENPAVNEPTEPTPPEEEIETPEKPEEPEIPNNDQPIEMPNENNVMEDNTVVGTNKNVSNLITTVTSTVCAVGFTIFAVSIIVLLRKRK